MYIMGFPGSGELKETLVDAAIEVNSQNLLIGSSSESSEGSSPAPVPEEELVALSVQVSNLPFLGGDFNEPQSCETNLLVEESGDDKTPEDEKLRPIITRELDGYLNDLKLAAIKKYRTRAVRPD